MSTGYKILDQNALQLPYGGYKGVMDLMMESGKQPGFWKFMK